MRAPVPSPGTVRRLMAPAAVVVVCATVLVCSTWNMLAQPRADAPLPDTVRFNRDIRPILSTKCYSCHGPDSGSRRAGLRLDDETIAKQKVVVAGDVDHSPLIARVTAADPKRRMPFGKDPLSTREIALLRRWIEQGASYEPHWAFIPPQRPSVPVIAGNWAKNAIDAFVLDRLTREGVKPSPEADRPTLIRRVSLDVIGLPPTPAEVDAFVADKSPNAYDKVVDRLLASPRYGERMAAPWLAAARFADTSGYTADPERDQHPWRDWVINAFNRNLPFDRFSTEQLAGDLLPNATVEQKVATGFNRNHRMMSEYGALADEFFAENIIDRASTLGTVWLGLTTGCARCHDHKFDPIKQKEFYQLFAYFNSSAESGMGQKGGNTPPMVPVPTPEQQAKLKELDAKIAAAELHLEKEFRAEITSTQRAWEQGLDETTLSLASVDASDGLVAYLPLSSDAERRFNGKRFVNGGTQDRLGPKNILTMAAWIQPEAPNGPIVTRTPLNTPRGTGYQLILSEGKLQLHLVNVRWKDESIQVETVAPIPLSERHHVAATYDGSRQVEGVHLYVDGVPQKLKVLYNAMGVADLEGADPLRIGAGGSPDRFRGTIDDVRLYDVALMPIEIAALAEPTSIPEIAAMPVDKRTPAQAEKIDSYYLKYQASTIIDYQRIGTGVHGAAANMQRASKDRPTVEKALAAIRAARKAKADYLDTVPTGMVMDELPQPRDTFILNRGAFDNPGTKVERGTPAFLPPKPKGAPGNRLGLAMWLFDPGHPLTARVAVNRYWEMLLGTGLVKTVDNFGSQGDLPSHPELLDWLATEFVRLKWDVKAMLKLMVTSATYRQSSRVPPALRERDPENRLLARGPRVRLPAEMVRDQLLAVSGLLSNKIGGPSVKPYQPDGVWEASMYKQDHGESLYRRSLYTFYRRSAPPPSLALFDVADRDTTAVGHHQTDTPLQALNVMNDVTFVEAARMLAERSLTEGGKTDAERVSYAFRVATATMPSESQLRVLLKSLVDFRERYRGDKAAALDLLSHGEHPRNETLDVAELAAHAVVARLIFNLDQVITKQ